ncbi:MAG: hypothetical protein ACFFEF_03275 [Candidatus Thorarchaeota archaeon]
MEGWLECPIEWAYYIHPARLEMFRVWKMVPIGGIILSKIPVKQADGRNFVSTEYIVVEKHGLRALTGKDEATLILAQQSIRFIKKNESFPPHCRMLRTYSNGDADLLFRPSNYDVFEIHISCTSFGENFAAYLALLKVRNSEGISTH